MPTLDRQDTLNVLATPYPQMMQNYLLRVTEEIFDGIPLPRSAEEWEAGRAELRAGLRAGFGELPEERCELEPEVTGVLAREGYRVEKVRLQTRPGWWAGVNVYLPERQEGPVPAVLLPLGHFPLGRRAQEMQTACATLARRGYVALTLDMPGYGDRAFLGGHGSPTYPPLLTVGLSLGGLQLWDNLRCLDYLCARPEVDPTRLGCTGASGGGSQTMYLTALDDRITCAVPTVYIGSAKRYPEWACCVCESVRGLVRLGDDWRILGLIAPRPLLVVNATLDPSFHIWHAHLSVNRLRRIYDFHERPEALEMTEFFRDHGFYQSARRAGYAWFDRWLQGVETDPGEIVEAPVWTEPEEGETLFVEGVSKSVSIPRMIARRAREIMAGRREEETPVRERLRERCLGGLPSARGPVPAVSVATLDRGEYTVEKLALRPEPDILVPALLLKPARAAERLPVCLYLHEMGKQSAAHNREAGEMLRAGWAVCAIDVRASGETGPVGHLMQKNLLLGRPLASLQLFDLLRAADYLQSRADLDTGRLALWAEGRFAFLALLAAALDARFTRTCCYRLLATYLDEDPNLQDPLHFLPDIIGEVGDICDLAALAAPRALMIASPRNGALETVPAGDFFGRTAEAYGEGGRLRLVDGGYEGMLEAWRGCLPETW